MTNDANPLADKKAQYAAWRDRLKHKDRDDEVIDLAHDETPSPWSPESLFTYDWSE